MSLSEKAVWCQAAATILCHSILLPPLGNTTEEEAFQRRLTSHVIHVQKCEREIQAAFELNRKSRKRLWPIINQSPNRQRVIQLAKFSLVYAHSGLWNEAEKLQIQVVDYASKTLGPRNPTTMDAMLLLSNTYWNLGNGSKAAELHETILDTCVHYLGKDDKRTVKTMDILGSSRWQQGRFKEAQLLHETAIQGMEQIPSCDMADILKAKGNLGRALGKNFRFTEAVELAKEVLLEYRKELVLDPHNSDILVAMDNLAMAYLDRVIYGVDQDGDLGHAYELEHEVFLERKDKLGKDHPYTLWSACNMARIIAHQGQVDEAISILQAGVGVAERDLGKSHLGTLFGRLHLGRVLLLGHRYEEAELMLQSLLEEYDGQLSTHPDRLVALFSLIQSRKYQGREAETLSLQSQLLQGAKEVFGEGHPWIDYLTDPNNYKIRRVSSHDPC